MQLGVLFCDQVGSTALLTELGDALAEEIRRDVFVGLYQAADLARGEVVKSSGDGLMVIFRAGARDAILCGQIMLDKVERLRASELFHSVQFKVGVSFGDAVFDRGDWYGAAVNLAARLCAAAESGQLLVSTSAVPNRRTGDWQPREALALKGFPDPEPVLSWQPASAGELRPLPADLDTSWSVPLVGRDVTLEKIRSATRDTSNSLHIAARPGVGLTRLLAEAAQQTTGSVLYASSRNPSGVLTQLIRSYAATASLEELRAAAGPDAAGLAGLCPLVGLRLSVAPSSDAPPELFDRLLARAAAARPALVLLDDIPEPDWQLPPGCTVVCGIRTDTSVNAPLSLTPLIESEISQLIGDAVQDRGWRDSLIELIKAETDGVARDVVAVLDELTRAGEPEHLAPDDAFAAVRRAVPYRGLQVFASDDTVRFHGRERAVSDVTGALETQPFVAVVGSSGSGKSSVVRAGCLPRLQAAGLDVITMAPGEAPLRALAAVWSERSDGQELLGQLRQDPTALTRTEQAGRARILTIDQLEESFTLCSDETERDQFLRVITRPVSGLRVLATLRGDFYGRASEHAELAEALRDGTVLMPPPTRGELRAMIETPAAQANLSLEPGLADLILVDVADRPGSLPLLSHALRETWRRRHGPLLAVADYQAAGGATGAIARTADTVFGQLSESEQEVAKRIFLRLTALGDGVEDSRRRVPADVLGSSPAARSILGTLTAARLITADTDAQGRDVDELAHEALLREWPRLRGWLDEDREQLTVLAHLETAARDWDAAGRPETELYVGRRLEAAEEVPRERFNEQELSYLDASLEQRQAQRRRSRRARRRLQFLALGLVVLLLVAVGAGLVALKQRSTARADARSAREQARTATAQDLRVQAQAQLAGQPALALLLAVEAERTQDSLDARSELFATVYNNPHLSRINSYNASLSDISVTDSINVPSISLSPDAKRIAITSNDKVSFRMYDFSNNQPLTPNIKPDSGQVLYTTWSNQDVLAVATSAGEIHLYSGKNGRPVGLARLPMGQTLAGGGGMVISPDGSILLLRRFRDGTIFRWSMPSGTQLGRPINLGGFGDVNFSPDGRRLAVMDRNGIDVLDPRSGRAMQPALRRSGYELDYSPNGKLLLLGQGDGPPVIVDARTGRSRLTLQFPSGYTGPDEFSNPARGVAYSPDGKYVASIDQAGTLVIWQTSDGSVVGGSANTGATQGQSDSFLAFTPDDHIVLANNENVIVWSISEDGALSADRPLSQHYPYQSATLVDARRHRILQIGSDRRLRIWDSRTLQLTSTEILPASYALLGTGLDPSSGRIAELVDNYLPSHPNATYSVDVFDPLHPNTTLRTFPIQGGPHAAAFSSNGDELAVSFDGNPNQVTGIGIGYLEVLDLSHPAQAPWTTRVDAAGGASLDWTRDGSEILYAGNSLLSAVSTRTHRVVASTGLQQYSHCCIGTVAPGNFVQAPNSLNGLFVSLGGNGDISFRDLDSRAKLPNDLNYGSTGGTNNVSNVNFSPNGQLIVLSGNNQLNLAANPSGRRLATAVPYSGTAQFLDQARLLVVDYTGGQEVLSLDVPQLEKMACAIAGRNLTRQEYKDFVSGQVYRKTCPQWPAGT